MRFYCKVRMKFIFAKYLTLLFLIFITLVIWNYKSTQVNHSQTCVMSQAYHDELHKLTAEVHRLLNILKLTHFLCYGSLWGQIRLSRVLPWEDKTTMCLLNEEVSEKDELTIARLFRNNGLMLSYDSVEGQYTVQKMNYAGRMRVILVIFELDKVVFMYRRIGMMRRLLPPNCDSMSSLNCFPPRLIDPPLPLKDFGGFLIPVPKEEFQLQKYHYPDNWWMEVMKKNC